MPYEQNFQRFYSVPYLKGNFISSAHFCVSCDGTDFIFTEYYCLLFLFSILGYSLVLLVFQIFYYRSIFGSKTCHILSVFFLFVNNHALPTWLSKINFRKFILLLSFSHVVRISRMCKSAEITVVWNFICLCFSRSSV